MTKPKSETTTTVGNAKVEPYTVTLAGRVVERGYTAEDWDAGFLGHFPTRAAAVKAAKKVQPKEVR